jgi:alpha-1,2-mannosyltransferase
MLNVSFTLEIMRLGSTIVWLESRFVFLFRDEMYPNLLQDRFNIPLHAPTINFLYLTSRHWVLASTWPRFTLLGQSLGSLILTWDAFSLLTPDIFVDTMGYAFASGLSKLLLSDVPTGSYVHYPTISTDMLESLDPDSPNGDQGVNAGSGAGLRGQVKKGYWHFFAMLYSWTGASIDIVMTNSNWTQRHIRSLWGEWRAELHKPQPMTVYPPVAVEELEREVEVSEESEARREPFLLYIAQFRPEKSHSLILTAFAEFMATKTAATKDAKLVLVGSVRDDSDSKRVYELRLLANELKIKDNVEFHLDASWPEILDWLRRASVGVNGMWNEHFGIGVVEYQAAGLISVVHNSGGPKRDIVVTVGGEPTGELSTPSSLNLLTFSGFHASTATEFAQGFEQALALPDKLATEEEFAKAWISQMEKLVRLRQLRAP